MARGDAVCSLNLLTFPDRLCCSRGTRSFYVSFSSFLSRAFPFEIVCTSIFPFFFFFRSLTALVALCSYLLTTVTPSGLDTRCPRSYTLLYILKTKLPRH